MAFKIFISYSTKDLHIVNQVKNLASGKNIELFVAQYSIVPSQILSNSIEYAISNCDLFILLWSQNSKSSEWVPQEIGIAKAYGKTILPIILDKQLTLPGFINDLKYLDATSNLNDALNWLETHLSNLAFNKLQKERIAILGTGALILYMLSDRK